MVGQETLRLTDPHPARGRVQIPYEMFLAWFEVTIGDMVIDAGKGPIHYD